MFVKPKPGLKVRDPEMQGFLPVAGRQVPQSLYWTRRLRDGDVVEAEPSLPAAGTADVPQPKEAGK